MKTMAAVAHHRNQCYSRSKPRSGCYRARSFEPGVGILPSPLALPVFHSEPRKYTKQIKPIAITPKADKKGSSFDKELSRSELWAGPVCSSSPPPSSLPIPKFSIPQKRSVSLDSPLVASAPTSPTRDAFTSATENLRRILQLDG